MGSPGVAVGPKLTNLCEDVGHLIGSHAEHLPELRVGLKQPVGVLPAEVNGCRRHRLTIAGVVLAVNE